jgi:hypothetical protein
VIEVPEVLEVFDDFDASADSSALSRVRVRVRVRVESVSTRGPVGPSGRGCGCSRSVLGAQWDPAGPSRPQWAPVGPSGCGCGCTRDPVGPSGA